MRQVNPRGPPGRGFSLAGGNFGGTLLGVPCERHVNRVAAPIYARPTLRAAATSRIEKQRSTHRHSDRRLQDRGLHPSRSPRLLAVEDVYTASGSAADAISRRVHLRTLARSFPRTT